MDVIARCLTLDLDPVTPDLSAHRGVGAADMARGRLARTDHASKHARTELPRGALLVHHAAYQGRLV